jgi:hypothetical protein
MFIFPKIHLKGMKPDKKGKPVKKNGDWTTSWAKIFLIMGCILFVGVFVMSYFMPVITDLIAPVKAQPGDTAVVDITLKDAQGRPVFTTNEGIYTQAVGKNQTVWLARYLTFTVNRTTSNLVEPVPATLSGQETQYFAFLGPETNQITENLVGMKQKSTKQIQFDQNLMFQNVTTREGFESIGGNFSAVHENQQMIFGLTIPSVSGDENSTPQYALRTVTLKNKTNETVTIDYGYKTADITILQLTKSS